MRFATTTTRQIWSPAARVGLAVACSALVGCNGGTVDRHALANDGDAVDSLACEGALLAQDVADGRTTRFFTRVHAGELAQRASNFADALSERPTLEPIEQDVRRLGRRAERIAGFLDELHRHPTDPDAGRRLAGELRSEGDCA
jgi:hypothetical protein